MTLAAIIAITVAWWALALYPVGAEVPEWVLRTRAACFGSVASGLPSAGGWVLLIGEPIGMFGVLVVVWGRPLRADLQWLARRWWGRVAVLGTGGVLVAGVAAVVLRVERARAATGDAMLFSLNTNTPITRLDAPAPALALLDQSGAPFDLAMLRNRPAIVTFAFAHCADVCPTIVHQLRAGRTQVGADTVPIVVVTLDPWRDVPSRLPHIATQWSLAPADRVLSGSVPAVNRVLDAWSVGRSRDTTTGEISHAAVAFVVNADGRLVARLDGAFDQVGNVLQQE